jgi:hypothetical protein
MKLWIKNILSSCVNEISHRQPFTVKVMRDVLFRWNSSWMNLNVRHAHDESKSTTHKDTGSLMILTSGNFSKPNKRVCTLECVKHTYLSLEPLDFHILQESPCSSFEFGNLFRPSSLLRHIHTFSDLKTQGKFINITYCNFWKQFRFKISLKWLQGYWKLELILQSRIA